MYRTFFILLFIVLASAKNVFSQKDTIHHATRTYTSAEKDSMDVWKYTSITLPCTYMTTEEKKVIQILNIARMYPKWYLYFYLKNPVTENEKSLYRTMMTMKTIPDPLIPSKKQYESAKCHAISSGKVGYVGHDRQGTCQAKFSGECCDYGNATAAEIVLSLLVDEDVPSLGHRTICLMGELKTIGVSMAPHKTYGINAVLDFGYED
jgi:uncharacterized protein YkwD